MYLYCVHNIIFWPFWHVNSKKEAIVQFYVHTDKMRSNYNVDSNTKSLNYMKIQFKALNYFELQQTSK